MVGIYSKDIASDAWVYAKYGDKAVKRFNKLAVYVAERISVMDGGDKCEYLEIGQRSTSKEAYLFADFSDGARMWFRSSDPDTPHIGRAGDQSAACPWGHECVA